MIPVYMIDRAVKHTGNGGNDAEIFRNYRA